MKFNKNEYFEAIEKSLSNAEELIEEAEILIKHDKYARAYTFFQLSIEEVGKANLAFQFVLKGDIENLQETKQFLKKFINHKTKTKSSQGIDFMYALSAEKSTFTKNLLQDFMLEHNDVDVSNDYKNYSLYTSFKDNKFQKPSEIITKDRVENIAHYAKLRLQVAKPFFMIGIQNYDILFETRNDLDEVAMSIKTQKKIEELLASKF
jgi:AbiV family abortive infection protein